MSINKVWGFALNKDQPNVIIKQENQEIDKLEKIYCPGMILVPLPTFEQNSKYIK